MRRSSALIWISFALAGCEYRLPPVVAVPPQRLRVIASEPNRYSLHIATRTYDVPEDGHVTVEIPPVRESCGPYLLGIKLPRGTDPTKVKIIDVLEGSRTVRQFTSKEFFSLPSDSMGYKVLRLGS